MNHHQSLPRPVAPFNLFPMRTDTGHEGLVLNGCDPKGNCNIPVCIFEESGNAFLHGFTIEEVTEIASGVKNALNSHAALVEALKFYASGSYNVWMGRAQDKLSVFSDGGNTARVALASLPTSVLSQTKAVEVQQ